METTYTSKEVAKILSTEYDCFRAWVFEEYVKPIAAPKRKRDYLWTVDDVYAAAFFRHLIEEGLSRKKAAEIVKLFQTTYKFANGYEYCVWFTNDNKINGVAFVDTIIPRDFEGHITCKIYNLYMIFEGLGLGD